VFSKVIDFPFGKLQIRVLVSVLFSTRSTREETSTQREHMPIVENEEATVDVGVSIGWPFGKVQFPVLQTGLI
jgi:hypothetical protein